MIRSIAAIFSGVRALVPMLIALLLPLAVLEAAPALVYQTYGIHDAKLSHAVGRLQTIIACGFAVHAALRVAGRHPKWRGEYLAWLMTTPWRPGLPLPLGSPAPAPLDGVRILAITGVASLFLQRFAAAPPIVYAIAYALASAFKLPRVGPKLAGVALWMILAAIVRVRTELLAVAALALVAYVVARFGMLASLRAYPWGEDEPKPHRPSLGAWFDKLSPRPPEPHISRFAGFALPIVIGWALYCLLARVQLEKGGEMKLGVFVVMGIGGVIAALARWAVYGGNHVSPISLAGRLRTGRVILPRHDVVFVAPLAGALLAGFMPLALLSAGCSPAAAIGLAVAAALLVLINAPPTVARWQLTAQCRITEPPPGTVET